MTNVDILLNVLNTSGESSFSHTLYAFMEAGLLSPSEFLEVITKARDVAYANGAKDEKDACARICKEQGEKMTWGKYVHPDHCAWLIQNR